jgi:uncharacterized protein with GYD domain
MATYITLVNFTDQGIRAIKEAPSRLDAAKELSKSLGGEFKAFYLTMGAYDVVTISEAPDDETAAKAALTVGSAGNVRTVTLRAFTEEDFRSIVGGIS